MRILLSRSCPFFSSRSIWPSSCISARICFLGVQQLALPDNARLCRTFPGQVCCMHVWQSHQETLAYQDTKQTQTKCQTESYRRTNLHQSIDLTYTRVSGTDDWQANNTTIYLRYCICGSCIRSHVSTSTEKYNWLRNSRGQEII